MREAEVQNGDALHSVETRPDRPPPSIRSPRYRPAVWLVAGLTFLNGASEVVRVLFGGLLSNQTFSELLPYGLYYWNRSLSLIFGVALVYLSLNLLERKRLAWWMTLLSSTLVLIIHALNELSTQELVFLDALIGPVFLILMLLVFREQFTVHSERRSIARAVGVVASSFALVLAYGTLGFWLADPSDFNNDFRLTEAFGQTLRELTFTAPPDTAGRTAQADWFLDSLNVASLSAVAFGAFSLFRPVAYRFRIQPHERNEAREILEKHGTSSLDFFKLYPCKSYFFSHTRRSFIAYRTEANVAVALGDPSGPEDELEDVIVRFLAYCRDNGWSVAFHQTLPDLLPLYARHGLRALKVGEEAVVELGPFASKTSRSKKMRYTRRRYGEREGYTARWHETPHSPELLEEIKSISDGWLTLPGRRERGFTLGKFDLDYLRKGRLFVVRDGGGRAQAFVNEVPSYREGEATIDLMRHRPDTPNGVMDFMLIELMLAYFGEGYERFDLGLAPLSGLGESTDSTLEERGLKMLSQRLERLFSYKGLREYKAKYNPAWEDRYLVYSGGPQNLLSIGVALVRLTEGEK